MTSRSCALLALLLLQHGPVVTHCDQDAVTAGPAMTHLFRRPPRSTHAPKHRLTSETNVTNMYPVNEHGRTTNLHVTIEPTASLGLHLAHESTRIRNKDYYEKISPGIPLTHKSARHVKHSSFSHKSEVPTVSPTYEPSDTPNLNPFFSTQPPFHSPYDTLYSAPATYSTLSSLLAKPRGIHHIIEQAALTFENSSAEENDSKTFGDEVPQQTYTGLGSTGKFRISATEPYIDPVTPLHVTAQVGSTARLSCFVNNLGQRSVSWVRHRDIHVLTVGHFTFTNDDRFEAFNEDGSNEWVLTIRFPTRADTGIYECQINTKPITSQLISLQVVQPRAVIVSGPEVYLNRGSTLHIRCSVLDSPRPLDFLLWYHGQKVANYEDSRVHIEVVEDENGTWSTLTLEAATEKDSGTYICSPSNSREAAVRVHVLRNGEHPAAMQTNAGSSWHKKNHLLFLPLLFIPLLQVGRRWGQDISSSSSSGYQAG